VQNAYARLDELPTEEALEREPRAPVFLHLVAAFQEPDIAGTVTALVASRYPHGHLHVVVVTKEDEERNPHPAMGISTGELVRRLRDTLPPYQQKRLTHMAMPGPGRKASQLNWALRAESLRDVPRLRWGQRCRLAARPRHLPLDRPAGDPGPGCQSLSGDHPVPRQL
jgi:hypothetical protein